MASRWRPAAWSYSAVDTMLSGCPYQLALDRILGLPTWDHPKAALGTAYHAAVETHELARMRWRLGYAGCQEAGRSENESLIVGLSALHHCNVRWTDRYDRDWAESSLETAVDHWWSASIPDGQPGAGGSLRDRVMGWEPLAVERRYAVWRPDVTARRISGIPDCVYLDDDGELVVVDHKSSDKFDRFPLDGNTVRAQAANYSRACVEAVNLPPIRKPERWPRVEFHIARTVTGKRADFAAARVVQVWPTDEDMELVDSRMRRADREAAAGRWNKNPDWFLCKPEWCPHHRDAGGPCDPLGPPEFDVVTGFPQPEPIG